MKLGKHMDITLKKVVLSTLAVLFAALSIASASAAYYDGAVYYPPGSVVGSGYGYGCGAVYVGCGAPIYTGYYYSPQTYGWSGWGYSRIYYNYHYPYARPNTFYPYLYRSYPAYAAYPFIGYYW